MLLKDLQFGPGTYSLAQVLERVAQVVKENPLRLSMRDWVAAKDGFVRNSLALDWEKQLPECGTVACAAGWGLLLLNKDSQDYQNGGHEFMSLFGELPTYRDEWAPWQLDLYGIFIHETGGGWLPQSEPQAAWLEQKIMWFLHEHPEASHITTTVATE